MGLNTEISWTDHTLNLFWGCVKVSPGCKFCYADTLDNRYNHDDRHWGPGSSRKLVRSWKKNLNDMRKSAIANNRRETVFVMSMGDIFENDQPLSNNHDTNWKTINDVRQEFFGMIPDYPELIFLLLTKRPENINKLVPREWLVGYTDNVTSEFRRVHSTGIGMTKVVGLCPQNVFFGCSVVNQEELNSSLKTISDAPGFSNKFMSMEPLLGAMDFEKAMFTMYGGKSPYFDEWQNYIDWVIVGGESGQKARPMNPDWARNLRDECLAAGIPFHFKQWGENYPIEGTEVMVEAISGEPIVVKKLTFEKRGKHNAGNVLDGKRHLGFPESFHQPLK